MTEESGGMVKITVSGRDEQAHRDFGMWPMIVVIEVVIRIITLYQTGACEC